MVGLADWRSLALASQVRAVAEVGACMFGPTVEAALEAPTGVGLVPESVGVGSSSNVSSMMNTKKWSLSMTAPYVFWCSDNYMPSQHSTCSDAQASEWRRRSISLLLLVMKTFSTCVIAVRSHSLLVYPIIII